MKRRTFLETTALALATSAARGGAAAPGEPQGPPALSGVTWDKAPCRFCGTGCHVQVGVKGGKIVAIAADPKAEVNRGSLCVKGYHVGLALYGGDRLTRPLLRKNGKLEPVSWDEALDVIRGRVLQDPRGFALYGSGQWTIPEGYAANKLAKGVLGANQIDANARLCMSSAVTGFLATYGVDEPAGCYDDLDACDVLVLWGNNPAEMHPVLFSRVLDRRARGEKVQIVDLGTRRTRSTGFADRYIELEPQGDMALACGIARALVHEGRHAADFVEQFCAFRAPSEPPTLEGRAIDFDEYRRLLEPYTPERVQELAGVSPADLTHLVGLFADRALRITSLWCMGMNQHTRGTATNCLVHGLHLLSGHFGRPGDAPTSLTGQPSACGTVREVGTLCHSLPGGGVVSRPEHRKQAEELWNLPPGRISDKPGHHTIELFRRFSTAADQGGDIHTIWVMVTNPGQSLPDRGRLFDPSRKLPGKFLIVSDVYPTETTRAADLVLPSALWVEKNGMFGNSERRTQQWYRMVKPPGEAREDLWQLLAVTRRLHDAGFAGAKDKDGAFVFRVERDGKEIPVWDYAHFHDVNVDERLFDEYRKFSRHKHKDLAPYAEYVKARGLRWPVVQQPDGSWRETRFRFAAFDDPYVQKGKAFDFYHSTTRNGRAQIWFHPHEAPPEVPDADYPLWLCTGRVLEHWHTGTMTRRIPQLAAAMPAAYVELHREDARALGVTSGDRVVVESRRGKVVVPAWIDGRGSPPRGTVFIPFFDETMLVNHLTLDAFDPFSKQPDYKKCAVRIRRPAPGELAG